MKMMKYNIPITKKNFISEIYLFVGHQYFDYVYEPLKLFGPGPKIMLILICIEIVYSILFPPDKLFYSVISSNRTYFLYIFVLL